jgi:hypothetical protein
LVQVKKNVFIYHKTRKPTAPLAVILTENVVMYVTPFKEMGYSVHIVVDTD